MLRRVAVVRTDVSGEHVASIISVTFFTITAVKTLKCYIVFRRFLQELHSVISQKTVFFIVTAVKTSNLNTFPSVLSRATPCNIPEDGILHSHRRENLRSYTNMLLDETFSVRIVSTVLVE
jgi:uncharacterized protein YebE (UPF0316 family)